MDAAINRLALAVSRFEHFINHRLNQLEQIMSLGLSDVQAAVATLTDKENALTTVVQQLVAVSADNATKLANALAAAAAAGTPLANAAQADIQAVITSLMGVASQAAALTGTVQAAIGDARGHD